MAENRVIGRSNGLPWHLPADLQRFKALTLGHAVIVGRRTFESLGRPLRGRRLIVLTHQSNYGTPGIEIARSLEEALERASGDPEVFIAGGGEIFRSALPRIGRIYLTVVHARIEGDRLFPELPPRAWLLVEDHRYLSDELHAYDYSFRRYERLG